MNSEEICQQQQQQYIRYLEAQVDRFSAFMITQKTLNQRHLQFQKTLNHVVKKIEKNEQKMALIEIYQNDNLFQCKKMTKERENIKILQMKFDSLQNQLKLIYKKLQFNQNKNFSQQQQYTPKSVQFSKNQSRKRQEQLNCEKNEDYNLQGKNKIYSSDQIIPSQSQKSVQMSKSALYQLHKLDQEEIYRYIEQIRQNLQIQIKKIEIETQKNKESILKLSNHFNNLSSINSINLQKFKRESRALVPKATSQSTKQITSPQVNHNLQSVTKRQIKKMEKRLNNLFTEKVEEISNNLRQNSLNENKNINNNQRISLKKYKLKTLQDQFQKGVGIKTSRNNEEPHEYWVNQKEKNQKRRKSLFNNDALKDKNLDNSNKKQKKSSKKKKTNNKQQKQEEHIDFYNKKKDKRQNSFSKQKRNKSKSKQIKSPRKKRHQIKLKQANDYMIY